MLYRYLAIKTKYGKHLALKIFIYAFPQWSYDKLKYLPNKIYLMNGIENIKITSDDFINAAKYGHLQVLQYLYPIFENLHHDEGGRESEIFACAFRWAAASGYLPVLQFLYSIFENLRHRDDEGGRESEIFAENSHAFRWAAKNKHKNVVKYLNKISKKK
jgi:hypothetical protein